MRAFRFSGSISFTNRITRLVLIVFSKTVTNQNSSVLVLFQDILFQKDLTSRAETCNFQGIRSIDIFWNNRLTFKIVSNGSFSFGKPCLLPSRTGCVEGKRGGRVHPEKLHYFMNSSTLVSINLQILMSIAKNTSTKFASESIRSMDPHPPTAHSWSNPPECPQRLWSKSEFEPSPLFRSFWTAGWF